MHVLHSIPHLLCRDRVANEGIWVACIWVVEPVPVLSPSMVLINWHRHPMNSPREARHEQSFLMSRHDTSTPMLLLHPERTWVPAMAKTHSTQDPSPKIQTSVCDLVSVIWAKMIYQHTLKIPTSCNCTERVCKHPWGGEVDPHDVMFRNHFAPDDGETKRRRWHEPSGSCA